MAIVGVSGKMQSGKDTVALMWQYIAQCYNLERTPSITDYHNYCECRADVLSDWQIKYFAGKLRKFVASITGIPLNDLFDDTVKSTVLPSFNKTPRQLLQLIGTEVCRVIDLNFHIIALMNDYKGTQGYEFSSDAPLHGIPTEEDELKYGSIVTNYPNWLIPDTRFPNELKAIEDRKGSVIRVERSWESRYPNLWKEYIRYKAIYPGSFMSWLVCEHDDLYRKHSHPSETSLDDHEFTYVINNNGTLEDLLNEVERVYNKIM